MLDSLFRIENMHVCFERGQLGFIGHSLSVISQSSRWPGESGIRGFSPLYEQFLGKGRGHHSSQVAQIQGRCWDLAPTLCRRGPGAISPLAPASGWASPLQGDCLQFPSYFVKN